MATGSPDTMPPAPGASVGESPGSGGASGAYANLDLLLDLEVPVIVVLAEKTITLGEVLSFSEGTVVPFGKHAGEPLDIMVHNRRIGSGKAIKVGERFGIHVRQVLTPEETLAALR